MTKEIIKVATKEEAVWMEVEEARSSVIKDLEKNLIVEKALVKLAQDKIATFK